MSRNQKAPLLAFVLVALVCCLILVESIRGEAVEQPTAAPAPTPAVSSTYPAGGETQPSVSGESDASLGSGGHHPTQPLGSALVTPGTGPQARHSSGPSASDGSVGASNGHTGQATGDTADTATDQAPNIQGPTNGPNRSRRGHKNPDVRAAFGPDGGRPEIPPKEPEPPVEQPAGEAPPVWIDPVGGIDEPTDQDDTVDPERPVVPEDEPVPTEGRK